MLGTGRRIEPALDHGWEIIRVDINPHFKPDLVADVRALPQMPFHVDVLWAGSALNWVMLRMLTDRRPWRYPYLFGNEEQSHPEGKGMPHQNKHRVEAVWDRREFLSYWKNVFTVARGESLGIADLISSVIGAILAIVVHCWPKEESAMTSLAWQIPIWVFLVVVVCRLVLAPYWIHNSQKRKLLEFEEKLTPRIKVSLDGDGVLIEPTTLQLPPGVPKQDGPLSKWVQFQISCATDVPLVNCKAWLISVKALDAKAEELVKEEMRCGWSNYPQRELDEIPAITISPPVTQRANLFSMYEGLNGLELQVVPRKQRLGEGIQKTGSYRIQVAVTAEGASSVSKTFIFKWQGFNNVSLLPE
jgi:hypothetical protein